MREQQIYSIPESNMIKLRAEIDKINKRAVKIGAPKIEMIEHGVEYKPDQNAINRMIEDPIGVNADQYEKAKQKAPKIKYHLIEINGEGPKIEGYTFVGSLDHYSLPGDVLIKTVPGEIIPKSHYNAAAVCDHCGKIRPRKNTYVLRADDGTHMQVGSQCVRDFIGYDPNQIARFLERVWKLTEDMDQDDGFGGGGSNGPTYFNSIETLKVSAAMIRNYGWVSKARANDSSDIATASLVAMIINPPFNEQERKQRKELIEDTDWDDQKDLTEAYAAIEWVQTKEDQNEYMTNLQKLANAEAIPDSGFGMWVSLVAAYQREQENLREKARQNHTNEWVGQVKERRRFTAELINTYSFSGQFGVVTIHKFIDDQGHSVVWFANTDSKMEKGHTYTFDATVKKHDQYNDWCQTHINRIKVIEEK